MQSEDCYLLGFSRFFPFPISHFPFRMSQLIKTLINICLLRLSPGALPASGFLLGLMAVVALISGVLHLVIVYTLIEALMLVLVDMLVLIVIAAFALSMRGRISRLNQTLSAMFGTGALLTIIGIPFIAGVPGKGDIATLFQLLLTGLFVWQIVVLGHIFRHALSTGWFTGTLGALAYIFISLSVSYSIIPPPNS
ncbi:MAG: hypothetical protein BMS9Abin15_0990 [Gammaproteobacteria bacterium]|nr:MAG: hypothetical protein BMS9Abin15_0990 [Gammaproteobacteria bacterium]